MTVYAIAQIEITNPQRYERYLARFMDVFRQHRGKLLAADENPRRLEGEWPYDKLILMSFPDEQAFRDWSESPAYLEIAADRKAGSTGCVLLVHGLGNT